MGQPRWLSFSEKRLKRQWQSCVGRCHLEIEKKSCETSCPAVGGAFGKWSGTEVKLDGVEYMIMKESDLMGVVVEAGGARKAA